MPGALVGASRAAMARRTKKSGELAIWRALDASTPDQFQAVAEVLLALRDHVGQEQPKPGPGAVKRDR